MQTLQLDKGYTWFPLSHLQYMDVFLHSFREARWPSGRASDSRARGRGFDHDSGRRVVSIISLQDTFTSSKSTGNTQEAVAQSRHD